eukprot:scaffold43082_cov44-Attheya_sp.AAC.1
MFFFCDCDCLVPTVTVRRTLPLPTALPTSKKLVAERKKQVAAISSLRRQARREVKDEGTPATVLIRALIRRYWND